MIKPAKPANEAKRQSLLESYEILNTHAETAYDDLTQVASQICQTPIAVISLIDNERQWFKSKMGLDATETPRDVSFCGHAILGPDLMEVRDAHEDQRFFDNPLVTGQPQIRFYAGAPLIMPSGEVLGTICVIDRNPKQLNADQKAALRTLARNVVIQLQLRSQLTCMAEREKALNILIQDSINTSKARTQFFSRMSHEIRTPINGVLGMMQALMTTPLDAKQNDYVRAAAESGENILHLVNDILDISTIESGKMKVEKVNFDLVETVGKSLRNFGWQATSKQLVLDFRTNVDNLNVQGDPTRLTQIMTNLIGNAIKFTMKGSVIVVLRATPNENGKTLVELSVSDTGIGISKEALPALFTPYGQADDSIHRRFGGSGLGLSISKDLAEALGGTLECSSQEGAGSIFTLKLEMEAATAPEAERVLAAGPRKDLSGINILIAEDEPTNQKVFKALCKTLNCNLTLVKNGNEAMAALRAGRFDVILMDYHMPECDGLEGTRLIRLHEKEHGTRTPVVAISATSEAADRELFIRAGMDDHLEKPIRIEEFRQKIEKWVQRR